MQHSSDDSKTDWQLLAIRALINEGKVADAGKQLSALPQSLTATQQQELSLLKAQYAVSTHNSVAAMQALKTTDISQLSADQKNRYYSTVIAATGSQPTLETVRAYIARQPLLTNGAEQQKNIDATWQALRTIPQQQSSNFMINANENVLQGWLDLLGVYERSNSDQDALKAGVKDWQTRYPDNPAAAHLPVGLLQSMNMTPASTNTIALLLPLTGPAAVFSQAIEQGFEDARNGVLAQNNGAVNTVPVGSANAPISAMSPAPTATAPTNGSSNGTAETNAASGAAVSPSATSLPGTPTQAPVSTANAAPAATPPATATPVTSGAGIQAAPANNQAQIKVYDTNSQPVAQLLQQAQSDGATLVVGPLLKENVQSVATAQTPLNILALNEPDGLQNHPNMCYFALSPEDEARDAANHMWAQNKRMPLLLVPSNNYGNRVAVAFTQQWQKLGGGQVDEQTFGSVADLKARINSNSGISMTGTPVTLPSASTSSSAVSVAGMTFDAPQTAPASSGTASGPIDSVYIVASQSELALLKPMITMSTGSRSTIALYASSRSAQSGAGPDFRLEMDGLQFSDIPLLSGANPALMQQAVAKFNNDYSLARLYAMGVDAWTLANHFSQLRQSSSYQINGNTGILSASQNCVINRTLSWNQYSHGEIVPVH